MMFDSILDKAKFKFVQMNKSKNDMSNDHM
jgi:hypothetical protein